MGFTLGACEMSEPTLSSDVDLRNSGADVLRQIIDLVKSNRSFPFPTLFWEWHQHPFAILGIDSLTNYISYLNSGDGSYAAATPRWRPVGL